MVLLQIFITAIVFYSIYYFSPVEIFTPLEQVIYGTQVLIIWGFMLYKLKLGIIFRMKSFLSLLRGYFVTIWLGIALILVEKLFYHSVGNEKYLIAFLFLFGVSDLIVLLLFKFVFYYTMRYYRMKGGNARKCILIADSTSLPFINSFIRQKDWGYIVTAIITEEDEFECDKYKIPVYHSIKDLIKLIREYPVDDVFYCMSINNKNYDIGAMIKYTNEIGVDFHILEQDYFINNDSEGDSNNYQNDIKFSTFSKTKNHYFSLKIKDLLDIVLSVIIIIVALPFLLIVAFIIKLSDGGSVFYRQERIGLNGRRFNLYKFRTMIPNADKLLDKLKDQNEADGPVFKIAKDPRITKIGKFLRKTSIDEFPQFYNVIKGDMSIVGPRPPLLLEVHQYERYQLRRLSMKPGITCIWQVKGRHEVNFEQWMQMDLEYIDNWSLWLDFKLMFSTIGVILKAKGN